MRDSRVGGIIIRVVFLFLVLKYNFLNRAIRIKSAAHYLYTKSPCQLPRYRVEILKCYSEKTTNFSHESRGTKGRTEEKRQKHAANPTNLTLQFRNENTENKICQGSSPEFGKLLCDKKVDLVTDRSKLQR